MANCGSTGEATRRRALLKVFGSVNGIREATEEQLAELSGLAPNSPPTSRQNCSVVRH